MTKKNKTLAGFAKKGFLSAAIAACFSVMLAPTAANAKSWDKSTEIKSPEDLIRWQSQMSRSSDEQREGLIAQDMKLQAMYDYAKTVAIRAAMTSTLDEMARVITTHGRELDAIYNFAPLMIQNRVVPPVITEARNLYNQDGKLQIRLSDAIYNIEEQARFSSTPPNWRSYLNFNSTSDAYQKLTYAAGDMKPTNKVEERVWIDATKEGWEMGARQANVVLEQAMNRLNRDYVGMVRFHTMVLQGKITMPSISSYNLYDNNEGNRLILGEELLQIDVLPTFKNTVDLDNGFKNALVPGQKLDMDKSRIETPLALEKEPTKEVYRAITQIRNGQDLTDQPWKDSINLIQTEDVVQKPAYISIEPPRSAPAPQQEYAPEVQQYAPEEDQYIQPNTFYEGPQLGSDSGAGFADTGSIPVIKTTTIIASNAMPSFESAANKTSKKKPVKKVSKKSSSKSKKKR